MNRNVKNYLPKRILKTDWMTVNKTNRRITEVFFNHIKDKSVETANIYRKHIKHFFCYIKSYKKNMPFYSLSSKDFKDYLDFVKDVLGLSFSSIRIKHRACSVLCEYIIHNANRRKYGFRDFSNFAIVVKLPKDPKPKHLNPVTEKEYVQCVHTLISHQMYAEAAWFTTVYYLGCPYNDIIQFKSSIINYPLINNEYVLSNPITNQYGKLIQYKIPLPVLDMWYLYLTYKKYPSEIIFSAAHHPDKPIQSSYTTNILNKIISYVLGRSVRMWSFTSNTDKIIECDDTNFIEKERIFDEPYISATTIDNNIDLLFTE